MPEGLLNISCHISKPTFWRSAKHSVQVKELLGAARSPLARLVQEARCRPAQDQYFSRTGPTPMDKGRRTVNSISPTYDQKAP